MVALRAVRSAELDPAELTALRRLLEAAFGPRFTDDDWEHCLGGRHVLARDGDFLVAHAAVVERRLVIGRTTLACGYVEAVATAPSYRRRGIGSLVMRRVNGLIEAEFPVGALSTGSHEFYERVGWRRWEGPSYVMRGGRRERTPGEDAGLMVLATRAVRLSWTDPIACEERSGDDW